METSGITSQVGREQFLNLLVAQLRNQNPLDPVDNAEFVSQLAQFSALEGVEKLNASFADMLALEQIGQGASLVGKTVVYQQPHMDAPDQGSVDGVSLEGGRMQLLVRGTLVSLDHVLGLAGGA